MQGGKLLGRQRGREGERDVDLDTAEATMVGLKGNKCQCNNGQVGKVIRHCTHGWYAGRDEQGGQRAAPAPQTMQGLTTPDPDEGRMASGGTGRLSPGVRGAPCAEIVGQRVTVGRGTLGQGPNRMERTAAMLRWRNWASRRKGWGSLVRICVCRALHAFPQVIAVKMLGDDSRRPAGTFTVGDDVRAVFPDP